MLREGAVRTVDRVARILRTLSGDRADGLALSDISRETGYGKTTTHRLLGALVDVGFVHQDTSNRRYRLGTLAIEIGRKAHEQGVAALVTPVLKRLAKDTGDTVFASIREGLSAICVAREVGSYPIQTLTLEVGDRRPLGVGAGSLALLAALPDREIEQVLRLNALWLKDYPGFDAEELRSLVARTRQEGYAFNEGRIVAGMCAIGVAVADRSGSPLAALSIAAIDQRMGQDRLPHLVERLQGEAARVSDLMASWNSEDSARC